jgi:hypothetical protein
MRCTQLDAWLKCSTLPGINQKGDTPSLEFFVRGRVLAQSETAAYTARNKERLARRLKNEAT